MKREFPICNWCDEPVLPGERRGGVNVPMHNDCLFRSLVGGANHILKICKCCGGTEPPDPPNLTKREAAHMALKVWHWIDDLKKVMAAGKVPRSPPFWGGGTD